MRRFHGLGTLVGARTNRLLVPVWRYRGSAAPPGQSMHAGCAGLAADIQRKAESVDLEKGAGGLPRDGLPGYVWCGWGALAPPHHLRGHGSDIA
jgi:hypothetical protein